MPGPRSFSETYTPDRLIAGQTQVVHENRTLITGQNLTRGAVVGVISSSQKITLSLAASSDGSQVPYGVLADDVDATSADVAGAPVMIAGEVNQARLVLGTGHTVDSIRAGLRDKGLFLKSSIPA